MATTDLRTGNTDNTNLMWVVLAIIAAAAILYFAMGYNGTDEATGTSPTTMRETVAPASDGTGAATGTYE